MAQKTERVTATPAALALIARLVEKHGAVLFHQSGGCCDGSSPMCYPTGEYLVSPDDVTLGEIGGAKFHMSPSQFEYWKYTQLIIDVVRVKATPEAVELINQLRSEHGDVLFHQSGGCCDGSAPMCYPVSDYQVGDDDVHLGTIGGAEIYISSSQFEYWQHTQLIIDVVPGRGGMFSLDNGREKRFLTRSTVCQVPG